MYDSYEEFARRLLIEVARKEMEEGGSIEDACSSIIDNNDLMGEIANDECPATLGLDLDTRMTIAAMLDEVACELCSEWLSGDD